MSVKEVLLKDGTVRYRFVVDVGRDPETGRRRQLTRTFDTRTEAEAERVRQVAATQRPISVRYRRAIADVLAEDLQTFALPDDRSEIATYAIIAAPYVKIGFSDNPLRRLSEVRSTSKLRVPADIDRSSAVLWLTFHGGRNTEDRLKWLARNYHVIGEWYWAEVPLREALERLAAAAPAAVAA